MTDRLDHAAANPPIGQDASSRSADVPDHLLTLDLSHSVIDPAGDTTMSDQYPPSNGNQPSWGPGNPPGNGGGPPKGNWNPPSPPAPPAPKRNWFARHKILTGIGALILIAAAASAAGGGGSSAASGSPSSDTSISTAGPTSAKSAASTPKTSSSPTKKPTEASARKPGIGAPVKDGNLQFVVTKVRTGVSQVGDEYLNQKAQGQYVLISITVTNVGKKSETFSDSDQKVQDAQGRTFSADSAAGIYLKDNQVLFETINPGNSARGVLAFDMPVGATPVSITLKDLSLFSGGTTVALK
ncbi:DUF4352 domain-containing protein [Dermatophilaceae bacterium Sec6.4]